MSVCNHNTHLQRRRRTFWEKVSGIKEIYVCQQCGHEVIVK